MNKTIKALSLSLLVLPIAANTGCTSFMASKNKQQLTLDPGQRTRGEVIDDNQIVTLLRINTDNLDPRIKEAKIDINSFNGVVLLTGQLPAEQLREMVGDAASTLKTVRQVHNQIQIASIPTIYSRINDNWLATKITSRIANNRIIEINRVKIIVANREVFIMGLLTETEAQNVTNIASTTTGVDKVIRAIELIPEHNRAPI